MAKVALLTIHGMGNTETEYSNQITLAQVNTMKWVPPSKPKQFRRL